MNDRKISMIQSRSWVLYFLFLLMMILVISNKKNLHVDEILTYGLANYEDGWMNPSGGVYNPAESAFTEYVTVHEDSRFDYNHVWKNQSKDVHPPLYYVLVHTICSLFPDRFSIWYTGIINIIFALLTLYVIRGLVYELVQSNEAVTLASVIFVFSAGILSSVTFLRMYVMTMFEVALVTLIFVRAAAKGHTWKFYIQVIMISVAGALTHYYFIVYLFFICLFWGVHLLIGRRFRDAGLFMISMILSGGLSIAVFPGMIKHMFLKEGYRGQESIENLTRFSITEYGSRLREFYSFLNESLLGNVFTYIVVAFLFLLIWCLVNRKNRKEILAMALSACRPDKISWGLAVLPGLCYFFLVSKMAVYTTSRYLFPVYAVIIAAFAAFIFSISNRIIRSSRRYLFLCVIASLITVNGWKVCSWQFLYLDSAALLEKADKYREVNNLYIYDDSWKIFSSFYEISKYKSVCFRSQDNVEGNGDIPYKSDLDLVLSITNSCNGELILNQILTTYPFLDSYEEIGGYGYSTSWHLYGRNFNSLQYRIYDDNHGKLIGCEDISGDGNIHMTMQDELVRGVFHKDTGYGTLWIDNRVFDIERGEIAAGSNIRLWDYNGTDAQLWKMEENEDGSCTFLSYHEDFAITKGPEGNIYLDKLSPDREGQKWWLEIEK